MAFEGAGAASAAALVRAWSPRALRGSSCARFSRVRTPLDEFVEGWGQGKAGEAGRGGGGETSTASTTCGSSLLLGAGPGVGGLAEYSFAAS